MYVQESVSDVWKLEFKQLSRTTSSNDLIYEHTLQDQDLDAVYKPSVITSINYGLDVKYIKACLGLILSVDDIFAYLYLIFILNKKQGLIIQNVIKQLLWINTSLCATVTEVNKQFLLYVRGSGSTRKT